ncbi:hypothetical protein AM587_10007737 [Phytophthora nicotianae]|uniref:Uncharacterized protein n=2 Tax=Phytophthora nicotianae TaxID=4792 RepID=V9DY16_PHYNI|nr:hypothetical protein F443_21783 [Phytophthora nicotianae P1569]ETL25039.1 hypothetical protein L916_21048 [Phytophthora nicotianae]KUF81967.1 hypothetical protein AM587_10007737 [Phytophthora nicotianae]
MTRGNRPPLQQVIDKLKEFADAEAEENYCNHCSSMVAAGSRFCSQRGTQVGDNTPPDTAPDDSYSTESARSPPSRPDPQESLEISDDDDDDAKSGDIPIPVLLDSIQGGNNANCEQALFRLLQLCIDEDPRKNLCDLNGVPVLVDAVKTCYSYFG